jgi:hypothetical protein
VDGASWRLISAFLGDWCVTSRCLLLIAGNPSSSKASRSEPALGSCTTVACSWSRSRRRILSRATPPAPTILRRRLSRATRSPWSQLTPLCSRRLSQEGAPRSLSRLVEQTRRPAQCDRLRARR